MWQLHVWCFLDRPVEILFRYTFHERTNNGKLLNYSLEASLITANKRFQKKRGKNFFFMSEMSNCKSQIDYVLINRNLKT